MFSLFVEGFLDSYDKAKWQTDRVSVVAFVCWFVSQPWVKIECS